MVLLELDPNVVKPGWIPLVITILLLAAIAFLYRSMRKQLGKIEAPYAADVRREKAESAAPEARVPDEAAAAIAPEDGTEESATGRSRR